MAFDGTVTAAVTAELAAALTDGRISRIAQPEKDELVLTVRTRSGDLKLLLSAQASLPVVCLTRRTFSSPMTAPNFCMLLRKYLSGGRITGVRQTGLDRVITFDIEHRDELGDSKTRHLIAELMGRHSNIILTDDSSVIIDSIKRIPLSLSSVREVLPGREYFPLNTRGQSDTLDLSMDVFAERVISSAAPLDKALVSGLSGIGPLTAQELCARAGIDSSRPADQLSDADSANLFNAVKALAEDIRAKRFSPCILYAKGVPSEYSAFEMKLFEGRETENFSSVSVLLESYYAGKDESVRIRQKSSDLRHIVQTRLERAYKKLELQRRQMEDTSKAGKYRVWGELLNAYGYGHDGGEKELKCLDYYTGEETVIPLDPSLSALDNAKKYFDRYGKLKRTAQALEPLIAAGNAEAEHLESIRTSLDLAENEADLAQIRRELEDAGFVRRREQAGGKGKRTDKAGAKNKNRKEKKPAASEPLHFISAEGFDIYVGKNNLQNEEVTFRLASGQDWWFHAKGRSGSHVIVKSAGTELPDELFVQAASLAAFYSSGRAESKVDVDYVQKREIRKVPGARPGYVIYHTNYSMTVTPGIADGLRQA